jgi:hypothetical protein
VDDAELQMIRESAERIVRDAIAGGVPSTRDMGEATWTAAVESGWCALGVPEQRGGVGGGPRELCALAEALGTGLQLGSMALNGTLAGQWLAAGGGGGGGEGGVGGRGGDAKRPVHQTAPPPPPPPPPRRCIARGPARWRTQSGAGGSPAD